MSSGGGGRGIRRGSDVVAPPHRTGEEISAMPPPRRQSLQRSTVWMLVLGTCWHLIHLVVSIVHVGPRLLQVLTYYAISTGLLERYRVLQLNKLRYLAIVVDSEEARHISEIQKLLNWLSDIGIKHVTLYDMEGVLKNFEAVLKKKNNADLPFPAPNNKAPIPLLSLEKMSIELLSASDGKEGVAKAAGFMYSKYLNDDNLGGNQTELPFTEGDMKNALRAVGYGGPEPDLLLVFGPVRCHFGFPAWRMRYTEIVHMGPLKSMKYGAIIKSIHDFSVKNQNYGS